MSEDRILVTGATGKTGRRVVRLLAERGAPVRAASRSSATRFDWTDRGTWEPALREVSAVYLVAPDFGSPIAEFAKQAAAAGVRRAVLLSAPGIEDELGGAGLAWTVLQPRWFFQNFSEDFLRDAVLSGELRLPAGDGREAFIDAEDIAEVAVAALTEDGHGGQHYELTGPRLMTFADVAEELSAATGRDIRYVPLTREAYVDEQRAHGVPEDWAQLSADLYEHIRSGGLATLTGHVRQVLDRAPRDFAGYATAAATQGAWRT
ncbi:NAD(P)H-binding protein [Crossiella sp. NPDC003009]